MDDSLEVPLPGKSFTEHDQCALILDRVRKLCGWSRPTFPGSQPVSFQRTSFQDVNRMAYVACEKTDGIRFLLFACCNFCFLIDRKEQVQATKLFLPQRFKPDQCHESTLLDGEFVTDIEAVPDPDDPGNLVQRRITRFLVYDGIVINGVPIRNNNLLERLCQVHQEVVEPRDAWEAKNPEAVLQERANSFYMGIYLKDFFEIWDIPAISNFATRLPHKSDGIIFTPVCLPYIPGTCQQLLKWKPPHLNTVDFFAEIVTESRESRVPRGVRLFAAAKGIKVFTGSWLAIEGPQIKEIFDEYRIGNTSVSMCIWECHYSHDVATYVPRPRGVHQDGQEEFDFSVTTMIEGGWVFERIRPDKSTPNDERVVASVINSIRDGVSFEELVESFRAFREAGKEAVSEHCVMFPDYSKHGCRMCIESSPATSGTPPPCSTADAPASE